jgi:dTDP-4-dehydrorhamnose reductase
MVIRASGCRHLIFRTSWVYATRGANFAKTILRLAKERDQLRVIADQFGAPTSAELIADVTALAMQRFMLDRKSPERVVGTYHLVASGETSWHSYAQFIIGEAARLGAKLRVVPERVIPIATEEYPLPAKRPANSRLANSKLQQTFGLVLPDWKFHVQRMIRELVDQGAA